MKLLASVVPLLAALAVTGCADETPLAPNPTAAVAAPQLAAAKGTSEIVPGEYVVVFKGSVADVAGKTRQKTNGRKPAKHTYSAAIKGYAAELSDSDVAALRADPDVAFVEPDRTVSMSTTQTGAPWGLDRLDQRALPLSGTYDYSTDASGVRVYVFDTGILFGHAEFGGRAVAGIDAITPGGSAADCNGHGTHVAGTVGGATYGVAKRVQLVAVRVLDCAGNGTTSTLIAGIDWVTKQKQASPAVPMVGNLSLGGSVSASLDAAIASSVAAGITYVVAAGNSATDACLGSPSRVPQAITVGASDASDGFASFSSHGTCVDVVAPGVGIASAYLGSNTAVVTASGTSMATPHVAGAAALYLAGNGAATPAQVSSALLAAATTGRVANRPAGTPDRLLHTGAPAVVAPVPTRLQVPLVNVGASLCLATVGGRSAAETQGTVAPCTGAADQTVNAPLVGSTGRMLLFADTRCLDVLGSTGRVGDHVGIYHCVAGSSTQAWTLNAAGELRGVNSLCVSAAASVLALQVCDGSPAQRWTVSASAPPPAEPPPVVTPPPTGRILASLRATSSGQCLATAGDRSVAETQGTTAACSGAPSQVVSVPAAGTAGQLLLFADSRCLDVLGSTGVVGDHVGIYSCVAGKPAQQWTLTAAGDVKGANGLCLTAGSAEGVVLTLQTCTGVASQRWTVSASAPPPAEPPPVVTPPPTGRILASLRATSSGQCLATAGDRSLAETQGTTATCSGAVSQAVSVPAAGTAGQLLLFGETRCLDVLGSTGIVGDHVGIYSCVAGKPAQQWTLTAAGDVKGANGLCLTAGSAEGIVLTLQTCTGAASQRWTAVPR